MFGFRIRYLRESVTAADVRCGREKDEVEWPLHPDRLFSALAQAWGDLGENEQSRASLEWLERLPPPFIRCGETLTTNAVVRFVPVNDNWDPTLSGAARQGACAPLVAGTLLGRDRKPVRIPTATLSDDIAELWWPDAIATPEHRASLAGIASAVASIGHPTCLVAVEVMDPDAAAPDPTWVPRSNGDKMLRVPACGRLGVLRESYHANRRRRPPLGEWATYGAATMVNQMPQGHHRDLIAFRLASEHPALPLEAVSKVIAVWRKAVLSKAEQPICEAISGHAADSTAGAPKPSGKAHLALIPIGDVGHPYARGHLLGVAAALPVGLTPHHRRACLRALGQVDSLTLGGLGVWRLERTDAEERRWGLRPETWSRPARVWASVTPVVFGRYPKDLWGAQAAAMIREACSIAGLPAPIEVATAPIAWIIGVPPSQRFPPFPSRPGKPRRAHAHVRLTFPTPVAGPLLVGAGRHQGYGVFRQLAEGSA